MANWLKNVKFYKFLKQMEIIKQDFESKVKKWAKWGYIADF